MDSISNVCKSSSEIYYYSSKHGKYCWRRLENERNSSSDFETSVLFPTSCAFQSREKKTGFDFSTSNLLFLGKICLVREVAFWKIQLAIFPKLSNALESLFSDPQHNKYRFKPNERSPSSAKFRSSSKTVINTCAENLATSLGPLGLSWPKLVLTTKDDFLASTSTIIPHVLNLHLSFSVHLCGRANRIS
jgi:hypothetical protein